MLATPALTEIFLVEGKPVMTGWGLGGRWLLLGCFGRIGQSAPSFLDATSLPGAVDARGVADPGGGVGSDSVSGGVIGSGAPSGEKRARAGIDGRLSRRESG
ncbi:MAG: hypothetical protein IPL51_13155 [Candidatus Competibacteraceae bacterium]|nr:hypothetical protein [Candidatus Competibacteraceae bacterium]